MTLLVTLFLVLINIFNTVNRKSPKVEGMNQNQNLDECK